MSEPKAFKEWVKSRHAILYNINAFYAASAGFEAGLASALAENEKLRGLLKELEWKGLIYMEDSYYNGCLFCENIRKVGHTKDCELSAAIKEPV